MKSDAGKFADTTTYHFSLVIHTIYDNVKDFNSGMTKYTQEILRFHLYDRVQKKDYADLAKGSTIYMWELKGAIKRLTDDNITGSK
jgi:hypothetical protein